MSPRFEELDYRQTAIGELSLRRRYEPYLDVDVIEIKLGEEYLMSSLFTTSEIALADLGISALHTESANVVVGGLGLGFTAQAVLAHNSVASLTVVEALDAVIDWHTSGLLPLGPKLSKDARCQFVHGDFFALAASPEGFDPQKPSRKFDAILVDIDHSPACLLDSQNAAFYQVDGLIKLTQHLNANGVFGLWSNDLPDKDFIAALDSVFDNTSAEEVMFNNPLQDKEFVQTIYLATMT
ncbi:MAG: spermidine synthase [Rhodospirillaceae bacterium]|nr:spermidine synthase [Rhodospirillaceae bacterium]